LRVLLDAHVFGRRIGRRLAAAGHDVLALDQDEVLSRLPDGKVLALASDENRILVTYNVSDFAGIVRQWGEAGRSHAGLILVTDSRAGFGPIVQRLEQMLAARPDQAEWVDRVGFLSSGSGSSAPPS
jgi:hypothetical protein